MKRATGLWLGFRRWTRRVRLFDALGIVFLVLNIGMAWWFLVHPLLAWMGGTVVSELFSLAGILAAAYLINRWDRHRQHQADQFMPNWEEVVGRAEKSE